MRFSFCVHQAAWNIQCPSGVLGLRERIALRPITQHALRWSAFLVFSSFASLRLCVELLTWLLLYPLVQRLDVLKLSVALP